MSSRKIAAKLYAMLMFIGVSVLCGLLVAGLGVPAAALASAATKAGADSLEQLPTDLSVPPQLEGSKMVLADGTLVAEFFDQNRQYVTLDQIAPVMQEAQVAIEDHRFYEHGALDLQGVIRAAAGNVIGGDVSGGGSTLTQQYVKQVRIQIALQSGDQKAVQEAQAPTMARKIAEMRYAVALEKSLEKQYPGQSKNIILERYLNIAYYGDGAYGVQAAAMHYFGVNAKDLNLPQAAMLAGLVQNPGETDPVHNPNDAIARRNVVLDAMVKWNEQDPGFIPNPDAPVVTEADAAAAKQVGFDKSKVVSVVQDCGNSSYPFICDYAKRIVQSDEMPSLGSTPEERWRTITQTNLTIVLTVNPASQQRAQASLDSMVVPTDPVIGTATILNPKTGAILAMAQSRPVMGDGTDGSTSYNYSVEATMGGAEGYTGGSTFKTFTAAAAINQGFNPDTANLNAPAQVDWKGKTFKSCDGPFVFNDNYVTTNSTGVNGVMNMVRAMQWSVNNYFVELERQVGGCDVTKMAEVTGVKISQPTEGQATLEDYSGNPSFTLGGANVTPLSVANAYGTFANKGIHCNPIIIAGIKTKDGKDLPGQNANCQQVIDPNVAAGTNYVMKSVMDGGLSVSARVPGNWDEASKTGSAGAADNESAVWFAGYTPDVVGVNMVAIDPSSGFWKSPQWGNRVPTLTSLPLAKGRFPGNSVNDTGAMWRQMMTPEIQDSPGTRFDAYKRPTSNPSNYTAPYTPPPPPPPAPSQRSSSAPSSSASQPAQPSAPASSAPPAPPASTEPTASNKPS